jgi:2-dehydropantoate 2-reductase
VLAAGLAQAQDVFLVDVDEALVAKLCASGVVVERDGEEHVVQIDTVASVADLPSVEIVFFCVKSYATRAAAESVAAIVDDETTVCSLQNGWGNGEVLAAQFDPHAVVVGVTYNSAAVSDGKVMHSGTGDTIVGPYLDHGLARAERVVEVLRSGGFAAEALDGVRMEIWKKLILNAATLPTAALTGLAAGQMWETKPMLELVDAVTREAVAVAHALGYDIDANERIELIHAVLERVGPGKASMLQDLEASRRTEIEVITGAVVRAGAELGVPVPLNQALQALVIGLERSKGLA